MSVFPRFAPRLQEAIVARLGWSSLRTVQDAAGAALLISRWVFQTALSKYRSASS